MILSKINYVIYTYKIKVAVLWYMHNAKSEWQMDLTTIASTTDISKYGYCM